MIVARRQKPVLLALATAAAFVFAIAADANVSMLQVGSDSFTNTTSQHRTAVEPDTFSAAGRVVAAFQLGRFTDGGASDVGFATGSKAGLTTGVLPGITKPESSGNPYDRDTDPSVAYDKRHNVWLISTLPLLSLSGVAVLVSRSTDGGLTWGNPVTVASATGSADFDKNWTVCDNTPASPFYGNCYTQYDDFGHGNQVHIARSTDGGLTWSEGSLPNQSVIGGQPLVQPNGTVIMPIDSGNEGSVLSLRSTDGGATWSSAVTIATIKDHLVAGNLRSGPLPSAEIDGSGKVYVVWEDCRFRRRCAANDIVMSTSSDGITWSAPARVPIDSTTSGIDHFIPGLGVDKATSGSTAHLGLAYYYYPVANCSSSTCELDVGFVSSSDGGATWSAPTQLAGPMTLSWLPNTTQGRMVGDYISTSFVGGKAHPVFAVASAPSSGGNDCASATPNCNEGMFTPASGLVAASQGFSASGDKALPDAASDHAAQQSAIFRR